MLQIEVKISKIVQIVLHGLASEDERDGASTAAPPSPHNRSSGDSCASIQEGH